MLYGYVNETYCEVEDVNITRMINAAGRCTFQAPLRFFSSPSQDFRNTVYSILWQHEVLISGVIESSSPVIKKGTSIDFISFTATDEIGLLTRKKAKSNANYQEQNAAFIIDDLIRTTSNWRLGYSEGFDFALNLTKDLRGKEHILGQVKELVESIPNCRFRYGGIWEDFYMLDIGPLGNQSGLSFIQGVNLTSPPKKNTQSKRLLYEIEAFGGQAGSREVYLKDASDGVPALLAHPTYPIVVLPDSTYVVRDLGNTNGDSVLKRYSNVKPANTATPTTPEIQQAGYALWQTCVNEFIKANTQNESYTINGQFFLTEEDTEMTAGDVPEIVQRVNQDFLKLKPGSTALTIARAEIPIFNYHAGDITWVAAIDLNEELALSDIELRFNNKSQLEFQVKTGIENDLDLYDPEIILSKEADANKKDVLGVGYVSPTGTGVSLVTDSQSGVAANAVMSTGEPARLFSLPMPAVPLGTTVLNFSLYANTDNATIETVQAAALPATGWIGRVIIGDDWDSSNSATLTGIFIFR